MILSKRLREIANYIIPELKTADIGTDHAYIPLFLLQNNLVPEVVACDINVGPLAKASETVQKYGLKNVELRLGPGLEPIEKGEVDQVVIAGMGGDLIVSILSKDLEKSRSVKHLILQPMGQTEVLRKFLNENGFRIESESIVKEEKGNTHFYSILSVFPGQEKVKEDLVYRYGEIGKIKKNQDLFDYLDYQIKQLQNRIEKMGSSENERTLARRHEMKRRLLYLKEIKNESLKNSKPD